jgi:hypothetical protein
MEESAREQARKDALRDEGIGPTDEERRAHERKRATAETARLVERSYKGYKGYFIRKSYASEFPRMR